MEDGKNCDFWSIFDAGSPFLENFDYVANSVWRAWFNSKVRKTRMDGASFERESLRSRSVYLHEDHLSRRKRPNRTHPTPELIRAFHLNLWLLTYSICYQCFCCNKTVGRIHFTKNDLVLKRYDHSTSSAFFSSLTRLLIWLYLPNRKKLKFAFSVAGSLSLCLSSLVWTNRKFLCFLHVMRYQS